MATTSSDQLAQLATTIKSAIPLTQHLAFTLQERVDNRLVLTAELAPNKNDKGTMFAGSIATLCTLAGWALTSEIAAEKQLQVDVVAVKNAMRYLKPVTTNAVVTATLDPAQLISFDKHMQRRGRARLSVVVEVVEVGEGSTAAQAVCARLEGDYMAQL